MLENIQNMSEKRSEMLRNSLGGLWKARVQVFGQEPRGALRVHSHTE